MLSERNRTKGKPYKSLITISVRSWIVSQRICCVFVRLSR